MKYIQEKYYVFKSSNRNTKILTREWKNFVKRIETDKIETITIITVNWLNTRNQGNQRNQNIQGRDITSFKHMKVNQIMQGIKN